LNVVTLGIRPVISAYMLVEFFAVLSARWRRLRHTVEGRRKLDRAVAIVIPLLAAFQAFGTTSYLTAVADVGRDVFVGPEGPWLFTTTIVAGACMTALGALLVDRQLIINGFLAIFAVDLLADAVSELLGRWGVFEEPTALASAIRFLLGGRK